MKNEKETYLSDWLIGTISDEQLKERVSDEDFLAYKKLKNTLDDLTLSEPDLDKNFSTIEQKKKSTEKQKDKKIFSLWSLTAIAASLLLLLGLYQMFYFSNQAVTQLGKIEVITLPDDSQVTLNTKSKLSYPNFFRFNRTLKLEGEAYFEVKKGSDFTVETSLGSVKVLGTKFNVNAYNGYFEVVCYQGKVRVQTKDKFVILTPTERVRFYESTFENWAENTTQRPSWLEGESTFKNVPLHYVIEQFQKQYNLEVNYPESVREIKFTGTFTNNNSATALQSICLPLRLKVTKNNSKTVTLSE